MGADGAIYAFGSPYYGRVTYEPQHQPPTGSVASLAQQIVDSPNVSYPLRSANGDTLAVLRDAARTGQFYTTCPTFPRRNVDINPRILQFVLAAAAQTSVGINAITDKCHSSNSAHYRGEAIDIQVGNKDYNDLIVSIARQYGGRRNSETSHIHLDFPR
jgi:hypothetical protein